MSTFNLKKIMCEIMLLNLKNKYLLLIPIIFALILSLKPTLFINGPLSWDIYTHVNYALAYLQNGLTTIDPFLDAPNGKLIGYPPLFHFLLIAISLITQLNLLTTAQILQPILVVLCTMSVVYVSYKLYDEIAAIASGFLLFSSFMFARLILPIPETVSIIFFIIGIYCFYKSSIDNTVIHGLLAGILGLFILATHFSTFIYYIIIISVLMLGQLVFKRKLSTIKSYLLTVISIGIVGIIGLIILRSINQDVFMELMKGILSIINNPLSLFMGQKAMGLERYLKCVGILPLIFGILGLIFSLKYKNHRLIALWALIAFVITNLHWIGVPVYTYRLLIYFVIPAVIVGGYSVSCLVEKLEGNDKKIGYIFLLALLLTSFLVGYTNLDDSSVVIASTETNQSTFQIAPPTSEEREVVDFFKSENNTNSSVLTNNLYFGTILSSSAEIPLHYSFDIYARPSSHKASLSYLNNENIGYIVYDKSLVLNNSTTVDGIPQIEFIEGDYYPVYYYDEEITEDNFNQIQISGTQVVFENNRFIVCKVNSYNNL